MDREFSTSRAICNAATVKSTGGKHVEAVSRAMQLLESLTLATEPRTLSELARDTELHPSTAFRILSTMIEAGMIDREDNSDKYALGPLAFQIARAAFTGGGYAASGEIMDKLAASTGESVSLAILEGTHAMVMMSRKSTQALAFSRNPGTTTPLLTTALGKVLLAFAEEHWNVTLFRNNPSLAEMASDDTDTGRALAAVREQGFAVVDHEEEVGLRSVCVPCLTLHGTASSAIALEGPVDRIPDSSIEAIVHELREAAHEITHLPRLRVR